MGVNAGSLMIAADIMNLSFFPVGMVITVSGTVQRNVMVEGNRGIRVNGQFLKDWIVCDGVQHQLSNGTNADTRDFKNRYISGTAESRGSFNGNPALSVNHLAAHTHTVSVTSSTSGSHTHAIRLDGHDDFNFTAGTDVGTGAGVGADGRLASSPSSASSGEWWINYPTNPSPILTSNASVSSHEHTVTGSILNTGNATSNLPLQPVFYTLIFIRKC
jgi:hypothetical protein